MAPVIISPIKEKTIYPHGYNHPGERRRVWYEIEKHTTDFRRCLPPPKGYIASNASLYKAAVQPKCGMRDSNILVFETCSKQLWLRTIK